MRTVSSKPVFAKLLWTLFINPRGLSKSLFQCWNKQCDIAVKNKKHAFNRMKQTWLLRDVIIFKRCRAKVRRVILEAKSSSWQQFCSSLTSNTNLSKVGKSSKASPVTAPGISFQRYLNKVFRPKINNTNPTLSQTSSLYPIVLLIILRDLLT